MLRRFIQQLLRRYKCTYPANAEEAMGRLKDYIVKHMRQNRQVSFIMLQAYNAIFGKVGRYFVCLHYDWENKSFYVSEGSKDTKENIFFAPYIDNEKSLANIKDWVCVDCDATMTTDGRCLIKMMHGSGENAPYISYIYAVYHDEEDQRSLIDWANRNIVVERVEEVRKNEFFIVKNVNGSLVGERTKIDDFDVDVKKNYNDDFPYEKICATIENKGVPDLMLFHGEPGTGKTMFLRHLIWKYSQKGDKVYYLDSSVACESSSTSLIEFLKDRKDCIIIVEDGEKLLTSRQNGTLAAILNLTDGILGTVCKNKFIFTFNCPLAQIDKALTRKGRLSLKYEFGKLKLEKAKMIWEGAECPMTLADLYNHEETNGMEAVKKIGFGTVN